MIIKSYEIYKKILEICKKLNVRCSREYSFKLSKNGFNDKRVYFILFNENKEQKYVFNKNLDYIKKKLKLPLVPSIKQNEIITEFLYAVDLQENLYKVYLAVVDNKTGLEIGYAEEYTSDVIVPRIYIEKKIKKNMVEKYSFLDKYKKYMNYNNFDTYYERTKNNKVDTIYLRYNILIKLYNLKLLFKKLCEHLGWDSKKVLHFFEENKNEDFYINDIGFSENSINLYFNKELD